MSLIDNKVVDAEELKEEDKKSMVKWARILGCAGLFFILAAAVVTIWGACLPDSATPDNHFIAYLNDIGFQAFFFFGTLVGIQAVWLYSNTFDKKKDPKALPIDLSLFHTSKAYGWGALAICLIVTVIYVVLW